MNKITILLFLLSFLLSACSKDDVIQNPNEHEIQENYICNDGVIDHTFLLDDWVFIRHSWYTSLQDDLYYSFTFREGNDYRYNLGTAPGIWNNYIYNQSTDEIELYNYSSNVIPDKFQILALDSVRMVLYNGPFCNDTCVLINNTYKEIYFQSACISNGCVDNSVPCDNGVCGCPSGDFGKTCSSTEEFFELTQDSELEKFIGSSEGQLILKTERDLGDDILCSYSNDGGLNWVVDESNISNSSVKI